MARCRYEVYIDEYILNRLSEKDRAAFEEHYFNCPACFEGLKDRAEVVAVIKNKGRELFKAEPKKVAQPRTEQRKPALFRPQLWWTAAVVVVTAVLVSAVFLIFHPVQKMPTFTLSGEDAIRGQTIGLVAPKGEIPSPPDFLEWKPLAEGTEYRACIRGLPEVWSQTTQESRIRLPEEVQQQMIPGQEYFWQVKGFSSRGALAAISVRQSFKIKAKK